MSEVMRMKGGGDEGWCVVRISEGDDEGWFVRMGGGEDE